MNNINIFPGQKIDDSLSPAELLDTETQNLFKLLHHYEALSWYVPAPTEGKVEIGAGLGTSVRLQRLGALPILGTLLLQEWSTFAAGPSYPGPSVHYRSRGWHTIPTIYALRRGFTNPADNRTNPIREARHIVPVDKDDTTRIVEAGLGFAFFRRAGNGNYVVNNSEASYRVTLSQEGDENEEITAKRVERYGTEEAITMHIRGIKPNEIKRFMQIFRDAIWDSVHEPA